VNTWTSVNAKVCVHCWAHGTRIFDVVSGSLRDMTHLPFGANEVWVTLCNESDLPKQLVPYARLAEISRRLDMRERGSPGGGGLADFESGHWSGYYNIDGERIPVTATDFEERMNTAMEGLPA